MWAILTGIEGNLAAYEAVIADLRRQPVEDLYILGDVLGLQGPVGPLLERLTHPQAGELTPQICSGFWEEQYLQMLGWMGGEPQREWVEPLMAAVPEGAVAWVRSLPFGFFELDCLLVHGSSQGVRDELTPATPPWELLDYLVRMDAHYLFTGRWGKPFHVELAESEITAEVITLDQPPLSQQAHLSERHVIGVGNVGRIPGEAHYGLFNPATGKMAFKSVAYSNAQ
ncbi:metallophosphatase [Spirulina sp. CCNP1310]|uniref:metallophosphatase n=1 Tax=Spirulina sp. CCNP1310 TaxID=3110249 RepID=UPI002B2081BD|nr:metallophosphatase [Spirulina sp. CCNP1310]MEA5419154.1 metallophosphatase [Spirulina sp. CCNP1310]